MYKNQEANQQRKKTDRQQIGKSFKQKKNYGVHWLALWP
jgi:hypothetical protein